MIAQKANEVVIIINIIDKYDQATGEAHLKSKYVISLNHKKKKDKFDENSQLF
jgi:hypothetical protein